ncbi:MAG: carboxypeptidase-like regulatory domain-containing protein, partial [Bacteroidales bacterium]
MNIKMFLAAIVLLSANLLNAQQDINITWKYDSLTFKQFVAAAEEKTGIRFFFRDDWVQDLRPGDYPGVSSLSELLDKLFVGKSLYLYRDNNDFIITKNYEIEHVDNKATRQISYTPEEYSYEREEQKTTESIHLDIGNPAEKDLQGNVNISGYIIESDSRESLSGATVYVQDLSAGTVSNQYGFFNLNLPRGAHLFQFSFLGKKEKRVYANVYGAGELKVELNSSLIPLRETIV